MKLINKLITKTAIYKHLKDLYEQALKDNDAYFNRVNKLIDDKNKISEQFHNMQVEYSKMQNDIFQIQKFNINQEKYISENQRLYKELEYYTKKEQEYFDKYYSLCVEIDYLINNNNFYFEEIDLKNAKKVLIEINKLIKNKKTGEIKKKLKKIRARVNKLDKKDENVKEIKRLIKEVL